jgi:phage recombination protein Bet
MSEVAVIDDRQIIEALEASHYPGALMSDVARVVQYCRVNRLDPFLKPVHLVPMSVKKAGTRDQYEWRIVLMPGIADYRIKAARSGEYAGKTEPEFGPDVTYELSGQTVHVPEWCRMTIYRLVGGEARAFSAREYWIENYATAGKNTEAPNMMWKKRARGQLAKCVEAQALRMAFPEFSGGGATAEEMEGKSFVGVTIDAEPVVAKAPAPEPINTAPPPKVKETPEERARQLISEIEATETEEACENLAERCSKAINYLHGLGMTELSDEVQDTFLRHKQMLKGEEAAA